MTDNTAKNLEILRLDRESNKMYNKVGRAQARITREGRRPTVAEVSEQKELLARADTLRNQMRALMASF